MAETPLFSPYSRGSGIAGWLSRMMWPGNVDEQNAAIEAAKFRVAAGEDPVDILNETKGQLGPRYAKVPYIEPSSEKLRRAALLMQPSSELTGQEQLGPVQQAPMFDWMRQFDQPPTPMASTGFQPLTAPPGLQPPTPSRATWGNEALFPQGSPVTDPFAPPSPQPFGTINLQFTGREGFQPAFVQQDAEPGLMQEPIGGATAYAQPPPPPDVIPEYLRRPQTMEAPPPPPDTFVPGGQRGHVPGRTFTELLTSDPRLGSFAAANLPKLQAAEAEYAGNQAVQGYVQDVSVNGMSEEDALKKWGAGLDQSPLGQKMADNARERLSQQVTARSTEATIAEKTRQAQIDADNRRFALDKAAQATAANKPAEAEMWTAMARDPKYAEELRQYRANELKAQELDKPILIEGQPYQLVRNAQGEPVMQPIAGVPQKAAKPWYEGITRAEAEAMSNDPALPPERRAQARQLADALQTGAEKVQAAGVLPPPKATVASDEKAGERVIMMRGLDQVADIVRRNPDFVGGSAKPLTAGKWAAAYETWDPLKGAAALAAQIPKEYDTFRANLSMFTAEKLHEMSGAALTPAEIKRYGAFLPSPWQSPERFQAGLLVSRQMLIGASQFYEARQAGKSIPEAQKIARDAIEQAYQEGVKQYGNPTTTSAPLTPAQEDLRTKYRK